MIPAKDPDKLVSLYFAIYERFNQLEFHKMVRELGLNVEHLWGNTYQDEVRETILFLRRRNRLEDLKNTCSKYKSNFDWSLSPITFKHHQEALFFSKNQIITLVATHFSLSELHQLCFLLGVDFENIAGYLLSDSKTNLTKKDIQHLEAYHIDLNTLSIEEIRVILKEEWMHKLLAHWNRQGQPISKFLDRVIYMKPKIFNN